MRNDMTKASLGALTQVGFIAVLSLMGFAAPPQALLSAAAGMKATYRDVEMASFEPSFAWATETKLALGANIGAASKD